MFLTKTITAPNGAALSHHFVDDVQIPHGSDELHLTILSWPNESSRLNRHEAVARSFLMVPIAELSLGSGLKAAILSALVNRPDWTGAATTVGSAPTLAGAKDRKWVEIKAERTRREFGTFTWDGSVFDADFASQVRMERKAAQALRAIINSTPFSEDWTLADNSVRTLSAAEMVALHTTLANGVSALHATARFLRAQIDGCTTVEQVEAIVWPA